MSDPASRAWRRKHRCSVRDMLPSGFTKMVRQAAVDENIRSHTTYLRPTSRQTFITLHLPVLDQAPGPRRGGVRADAPTRPAGSSHAGPPARIEDFGDAGLVLLVRGQDLRVGIKSRCGGADQGEGADGDERAPRRPANVGAERLDILRVILVPTDALVPHLTSPAGLGVEVGQPAVVRIEVPVAELAEGV